jgi:hypothetical protein
VINAWLRGWMKLVENLAQWYDFVLFILNPSVRHRRFRVLYGAESMTGMCSAVFLEEILSPELFP